jgi:hypothetical protein
MRSFACRIPRAFIANGALERVGFSDSGYRRPNTRAFAAAGSTATHVPPLCQSGARKRALSARGPLRLLHTAPVTYGIAFLPQRLVRRCRKHKTSATSSGRSPDWGGGGGGGGGWLVLLVPLAGTRHRTCQWPVASSGMQPRSPRPGCVCDRADELGKTEIADESASERGVGTQTGGGTCGGAGGGAGGSMCSVYRACGWDAPQSMASASQATPQAVQTAHPQTKMPIKGMGWRLADGDFDADAPRPALALASTEWAAWPIRAGRADPAGLRRRLLARPCCLLGKKPRRPRGSRTHHERQEALPTRALLLTR